MTDPVDRPLLSAANLPGARRNQAPEPERLLVIKHGALGDFVQALGPMKAIREAHPAAHITLLTTQPFAELGRRSGYVDDVWIDDKPKWRWGAWKALRDKLVSGRFARVYDLQTSGRSGRYLWLFPQPRPQWSGIALGASHPHSNLRRNAMHTLDRQAEQLRMAGIARVPPPDLSWADADIGRFGLEPRFALLVPGGSAHRPEKRWPRAQYAKLARALSADGVQPVLIGSGAEAGLTAAIKAEAPRAADLAGRTGFLDLAALARKAIVAVGNDTGPMHLFAVAGAPCLVLFSAASDPALCAPRGDWVRVIRSTDLKDVGVEDVLSALAFLERD